MTENSISLAVAGSGDIDPENVKALLNDWLGFGDEDDEGFPEPSEREIVLYAPMGEALTPGVRTVLEWADYADVPYVLVTQDGEQEDKKLRKLVRGADDVITVSNIGAELVDNLEKAEGEAFLLLLWGDGGDEFSEMLLDLASAAEVPAKDLTAGLDDISFAEETEPEPEPEPEPAPKAKGKKKAKVEEELTQEEEPLVDEAQAEFRPEPKEKKSDYSVKEVLTIVLAYLNAQDRVNAVKNLDEPRPSPLTALVSETLASLGQDASQEAADGTESQDPAPEEDEDAPEEPKRSRGRPRKDGTPAQARGEDAQKIAFIKDEDGNYRKRGRGRPKSGEEVVHLTAAEIADLGLDGNDD